MLNFLKAKKNKTIIIGELHSEPLRPDFIWVVIIGVSLSCALLTAILSAFLSWKILKGDPFISASHGTDSGGIATIDKNKLGKAIDIISTRYGSD